jgi:hypothetical protein
VYVAADKGREEGDRSATRPRWRLSIIRRLASVRDQFENSTGAEFLTQLSPCHGLDMGCNMTTM